MEIKGSEWNIWDLHVHSPASFGGNDYDTFIKNLLNSEALVIGINDYCSLNGYKTIKDKGGAPNKYIFPVIEFRMHNIVSNRKNSPVGGGAKINFHVIFDNATDLFPTIENWLNSLQCTNHFGDNALLGTIQKEDIPKLLLILKAYFKV